jgi:UbiD family decarboxylase
MTWKSLRQWTDSLSDRGDLVEIDDPVSTKFEIAAYVQKSCSEAGPAFLFTNVEDHDMDVLAGVYGTQERVLDAIHATSHQEGVEKFRSADENRIEPVVVDDGPVREVIETNPDLYDVPIVHHSERDAGHYITAGTLVANLPHTGVRGQGIHRMMRRDDDELTIWAPEERRIGYAYRVNADAGEPTELAVVIGPPPEVTMGGVSNVTHSVDKFSVAGGLSGEAIELVECETVDIEVPATAEMVIEGVIRPDEKVPEAPFGEFPGCYSGEQRTPIVDVTAITRREDARYHTILTGFPPNENNFMNWVPRSATVETDAERAVPAVDQAVVRCDENGGNGMYEAFVSIDKRLDGDPLNVINSVLGGRSQAKYCMVVDEDIDLYDPRQINWAKNTRVQPDRDVHTFAAMTGAPLDPSGPNRQSQKMGMDATVPLDEERQKFERVRVPGSDEVDW